MKVEKILVPIDYSEHSTLALEWGASLAQKYGAQLLLLHVVHKAMEEVPTHPTGPIVAPYSSYEESMAQHGSPSQSEVVIIDYIEKAETELYDLARSQLKESVPAKARVAVGRTAEEILQVAGDEGVDLIVMGTHGRTGLRHVLLGSVAETVVRTAPCPVFTVKAHPQVAP
jgi:nucleotide-binding universal stress UspA family protein